jgi:hypothetical protein
MHDPVFIVGLMMTALVGGGIAWKYATWNLYRRPGAEWATDEIHPDRINRRLLARRKRQRLQMTAMAALITPILIYAFLVLLGTVMEHAYTR